MSDASPDAPEPDSSPARDDLAARVAALERALADADDPPGRDAPLTDTTVEARLDRLAARLDDLDAALLAVRGYVGQVRHVNREVERTAEAALETAERAVDRPDAETTRTAPLRAPNGDPVRATALDAEPTDGPSNGPNAPNAPGAPDRRHDTPDEQNGEGLLARVRRVL